MSIDSISKPESDFNERIAALSAAKRELLALRLKRDSDASREQGTIPQRAHRDSSPLSFAQQRLWFLDQLEPNSALYNIPMALRLRGALNIAALQKTLDALVDRHESLRTTFVSVNGSPEQVIAKSRPVELPVIDLNNHPTAEREAEIERRFEEAAQRPFDLSRDLMLRAVLIRLRELEYVLLLVMHHIASDGWSIGVLSRELAAFYTAFVTGIPVSLPPLPIQYADFAVWQRQWLQGEVLEKQLAYWKQQLEDSPPALELPTDYPRPATQTFRALRQSVTLPTPLTEALNAVSRREGVTLSMTLLAAFQTLLHRYTGQNDIVIGSFIANRNRAEIEELIGFFVNTLVMRTDLSENPTFRELLRRVRQVVLAADAHQDLPFEKLVEVLQPMRSLSRTPLFQVSFNSLNFGDKRIELPELTIESVSTPEVGSKFDLTLSTREKNERIELDLVYKADLFDSRTTTRLLGHFETLLEGIVANPEERLSTLPLLTEEERQQLLVEWNNTKISYANDQCIHQLFEAQVDQTPEAIAVVFEQQQLTYGELNARANQLAHYLQKLGVRPEVLVGICVERSLEMIVGLLGILKAEGAYVPLDPSYPEERLRYMLEDGGVEVLLTQEALMEKIPQFKSQAGSDTVKTIYLDRDWSRVSCESEEDPQPGGTAENLAYLMYTSGSTGQPKGVGIPQRAVSRLVLEANYARFGQDEVFLQMAPTSFDASTFELWGALLHGSRCVLYPGGTPNLTDLRRQIERNGVTTLWLTASLFNTVIDDAPEILRPIRQLLIGGEALSTAHVRRANDLLPETQIINGYGPTENTTFTCCYPIQKVLGSSRSIPIGRSITNTQVYLLDKYLNLVPVGVAGELYTGGEGLARGYWGRADLTAERFVPNPFSRTGGERLYRTGDLARYLPSGDIEFLGRVDNQVKLRGFRIELGEIEAVLSQHPALREVVVLAERDARGEKQLVAYAVAERHLRPTTTDLRNFLKEKLPEYMVPAVFVLLDALPLTPTGKVDRLALPASDRSRPELEKTFVAPRDALELQLTYLWEEVLGVRPVGVRDNFFDLGGNSLLAVRLFASMEKSLGKRLPLTTVFQEGTVEHLANVLRQGAKPAPQSALVAIQPRGSKRPLFLAHPVGGHAFFCVHLARHLGPDQPFYALRAKGLEEGEDLYTRIEDMAADYIKAVQTVQQEGPYLLGGWSMGGVIAFEMAQQLRAQGQKVTLLALLDCYRLGARYEVNFFVQRAKFHLRNLSRLGPNEKLTYIGQKAKILKNRIYDTAHRSYEPRRYPLSRFEIVMQANHQAARKYVPHVYPGRITVFRGNVGNLGRYPDPLLGWGKLAAGGVEAYDVPGDHLTMVEDPQVGTLAEQLKACLDKAQEDSIANGEHPRQLPSRAQVDNSVEYAHAVSISQPDPLVPVNRATRQVS